MDVNYLDSNEKPLTNRCDKSAAPLRGVATCSGALRWELRSAAQLKWSSSVSHACVCSLIHSVHTLVYTCESGSKTREGGRSQLIKSFTDHSGTWILFWMRWTMLEGFELRSSGLWSLQLLWATTGRCGEKAAHWMFGELESWALPSMCPLKPWLGTVRKVAVSPCVLPAFTGSPSPPSPSCSESWEMNCEQATRLPHPLVSPLVSASGEATESGRERRFIVK